MRIREWIQKERKPKVKSGLFLWAVLTSVCFLRFPEVLLVADNSSKAYVIEELSPEEKQKMVDQLLLEGDQYLEGKNYNLANASYESVFLLDPNHVGASQRIDRLKKLMLKEGKSETELVTRVYDQEIDWRVREYLKHAKELIAEGKWGQARFTLQKLLLIHPLHEEANQLYKDLNQKSKTVTS